LPGRRAFRFPLFLESRLAAGANCAAGADTDPINTFKELAPQLSWRVENNADGAPVLMLRKAR
jgi:hypothetical protein